MVKKNSQINRIMLAGTGSGCGKTTVTCALLKALSDKGLKPISFKCGPDYIDPMFHSEILGTKSRNLDLFLCGENTVKYLLADAMEELEGSAGGTGYAVIEGVMGMYDGLGFEDDSFSANSYFPGYRDASGSGNRGQRQEPFTSGRAVRLS